MTKAGGTDHLVDMTVTFLELDSRPGKLPPQPTHPRLALMRAEGIPPRFYRYLYDAVGRPFLWVERAIMSDEALAAEIHRKGTEVWLLYANGAPAGYFELDFADAATTKLVYFGLISDWTGQKIGPWLLGSAIAESLSRGAGRVVVNTSSLDHPAALPLYQRLGFRPVRREVRQVRVPGGYTLPGHIAARMTP